MCPAEGPDRATTGYGWSSNRWNGSIVLFLLPIVGAIVDLVFFGVAHNHDLAAKGFLTLLDKTGETVTYPVHLIRLGFEIRFNVRVVVHVDIVEFRLRRVYAGDTLRGGVAVCGFAPGLR